VVTLVTCIPLGMASGPVLQTAGISWWQSLGGILAVFTLLLLCLRFLGRFHRGQKHHEASLLEVWPLGPRREIQVVRLRDTIHYIYRHEAALVLLDQENFASYRVTHPGETNRSPGGLTKLFYRMGMMSRPGGPAEVKTAESADLAGDLSR